MRDLDQVLKQKGMSRAGVGLEPATGGAASASRLRTAAPAGKGQSPFSYGVAATLGLCALVLIASAVALTVLGAPDQIANDPSMEEIGDIAPAAGPADAPLPASEELHNLMPELGQAETLQPQAE